MTWDAYRRRNTIITTVLASADADASVTLDSALAAQPDAREVYPDPMLALLDIQLRWSAALSTRLDVLVGAGADTPEIGVVNAWIDTAAAMPGARRLLDAGRQAPEMAKAIDKENTLLACVAGVPAMAPTLLEQGRAIAEQARDQSVLPEIAAAPADNLSFLHRLRNALAA